MAAAGFTTHSMQVMLSVGNTVFSAFPPLHPGRPALPRPEHLLGALEL
jgi:hypothetical protein